LVDNPAFIAYNRVTISTTGRETVGNTFLETLMTSRLSERAQEFRAKASAELAEGVSRQRFAALLALASRHAKREPLALTAEEQAQAETLLPGWTPAAWNRLELLRVALILARSDLAEASFAEDFEAQFQFADEGETCALYRSLPLLPDGARFAWRAAEACRTNMLTVFEAVALDSPYPVQHFDDLAWNQLVVKALFLDCPLYRISGLDTRLSAELTRMALDWAEERHSAGRGYYLGLWLCLGPYDPARVRALLEQHWPRATPLERRAMALAAGRAGQGDWLQEATAAEPDAEVKVDLQRASEGRYGQADFEPLFLSVNSSH